MPTDNDDGITVIDMTDPEHPAYCFVSLSETEFGVHIPLSAEQYLCSYYPVPTSEKMKKEETWLNQEYLLSVTATLHGEKMVTIKMLADTWPDEYKGKLETTMDRSASPEGKPMSSTIPRLANLTVAPAVGHALAIGNTVQIEEILWMPNNTKLVKATLRNALPFPDSGMLLLGKVIFQEMKCGNGTVDLSGFTLSPVQVLQVVSSLDGVKALNLSYNSEITTDTIRGLLISLPHLKRLILLGCEAITDDDLKEILSLDAKLFYNLEALIHLCLLSDKASYPNVFAYIGVVEDRNMVTSCSLAYFSPSSIVQALTDFL